MNRLSGDQNGKVPPSVPGIGRCASAGDRPQPDLVSGFGRRRRTRCSGHQETPPPVWRCQCLQPSGPPNDVFSGGAIVNCTGSAAGATSPARRSAMIAVAIRAMVDSAATSHATRFDRAGGVARPCRGAIARSGCHPFEIAQQIARALIPVVRILREARADDAVERRRGDGLDARHRRRLVLQNRAEQARARLAFERRAAGEHLEQQRAEREDVGARVGLEPFDLFGRHVLKRPEDRALRRQVRRRRRQHRQRRSSRRPARRSSPGRSRAASRPPSSSMTFAGFRSRWTMPERCALSSASQMSMAIFSASFGSRPHVPRRCRAPGVRPASPLRDTPARGSRRRPDARRRTACRCADD